MSENVLNDDDGVNRKWESTKNCIVSTAEKLLEREWAPIIQDWFNNKCRSANKNKKKHIEKRLMRNSQGMQLKNISRPGERRKDYIRVKRNNTEKIC